MTSDDSRTKIMTYKKMERLRSENSPAEASFNLFERLKA